MEKETETTVLWGGGHIGTLNPNLWVLHALLTRGFSSSGLAYGFTFGRCRGRV